MKRFIFGAAILLSARWAWAGITYAKQPDGTVVKTEVISTVLQATDAEAVKDDLTKQVADLTFQIVQINALILSRQGAITTYTNDISSMQITVSQFTALRDQKAIEISK